ncbi:hypothetical protein TWF569_001925 [Orbilia oligospora]|nr:hypothetical protein TWF706_006326 [Orbilia oligospora]KAF3146265.1 hypothetical protein TWF594_003582 [Orbilia oligospora]KAF3153613.1 hypothetical protein TWF569_001925 [Orbilia oligospora]
MEFYMTDIPASARPKQIRAALGSVLKKYFIYAFELRQWQSKKFRHLQEGCFTVHDAAIGEEIFRRHGTGEPKSILRGTRYIKIVSRAQTPVIISGSAITIKRSNKNSAVPEHLIRALSEENEKVARNMANRQPADQKPYRTPFAFQGFECGVWTTDPRNFDLPTFSSFYYSARPGNFKMTRQAIQVELFKTTPASGHPVGQYMLCPTGTIRSSIISNESTGTYFIISLRWSPKLYEKLESTSSPTSPLNGYGNPIFQAPPSRRLNKARISSLDEKHAKIVSYCFVYRFKLKEAHEAIRLSTVGSIPGFQDIQSLKIFHQYVSYDFQRSMEGLEEQLRTLPFDVAFQMHSLVLNGVLLPHRVKELLGVVRRAIQNSYSSVSQVESNRDSNGIGINAREHATQVVASVFKSWAGEWEPQLPSEDPQIWLSENIQKDFLEALETKQKSQEYMVRMKFYRKENQVLIHRMSITPTGMFPGGPNLEPKNRVLREYHDYLNHFLRVSLVEEDGGDLRFESGVDGKYIYDGRFLPFLMPESNLLKIAGRTFKFLGFSQSSLRSHTAWFMATIATPRRTITVDRVIELLGDFKSIKIPGKCAARIGQAFTDTVANIKIDDFMIAQKRDIIKIGPGGKKYTFSDGCGTVSKPLIEMIWKKGEFTSDPKPTVFQIRFRGAKGVVALDSTQRDPILSLYDSMVKFDGLRNRVFEICRSFTKPLPFYLNRCIIKILEDRGVPIKNFMDLQGRALATLRERTFTPDSAAHFLDYQNRCTQANIPFLIRELFALGWDYKEDNFLRKVVEFTMLTTLRDMKYRARIQVDKGFTLVGVLDETGYLQEGEIYCPIQKEGGKREAHRGVVAICRNPALHPGDIQVVTAVEVPYDSPLRDLINCVVFSQKGQRDLPSMLSGGDLDGDIFHIWWEPSLMPRFSSPPSDFPAVEALNYDRDVTQADIGKFFLDFMENDKLGVISIAHMVLADQEQAGVRSAACLTCARMASQAVDFPKTGVPVRMSELPRTPKARPDFLAPGPGVKFIGGNPNLVTDEYEDEFKYEWLDVETGQIDLSKFDDADDPFKSGTDFRYYKSDKALGYLFREIDEEKFIKTWEDNAARFERGPNDLLKKVQEYMVRSVDMEVMLGLYGFAQDLRISYENNIRDLSHNYAINRNNDALEEVEVFIGAIIGTESHRLSRIVRDSAEEMRGEVTRLISHVAAIIRFGSEGSSAVKDGNYDGLTLERALACVQASFTAREDDEGGSSFGWIAAAIGLKELSKRAVVNSLADNLVGMRI